VLVTPDGPVAVMTVGSLRCVRLQVGTAGRQPV